MSQKPSPSKSDISPPLLNAEGTPPRSRLTRFFKLRSSSSRSPIASPRQKEKGSGGDKNSAREPQQQPPPSPASFSRAASPSSKKQEDDFLGMLGGHREIPPAFADDMAKYRAAGITRAIQSPVVEPSSPSQDSAKSSSNPEEKLLPSRVDPELASSFGDGDSEQEIKQRSISSLAASQAKLDIPSPSQGPSQAPVIRSLSFNGLSAPATPSALSPEPSPAIVPQPLDLSVPDSPISVTVPPLALPPSLAISSLPKIARRKSKKEKDGPERKAEEVEREIKQRRDSIRRERNQSRAELNLLWKVQADEEFGKAKEKFIGQYKLGKFLGAGTCGTVKMAIDTKTNKDVALKIVPKKSLQEESKKWERLKREIIVLRLIKHPNILRVLDVMESKDHMFIVTEFAAGGELFDYIFSSNSRKGLPRRETLKLLSQMILALEHVHDRSICHRDLKPENILLDQNNNILLADFGFSQLMKKPGKCCKTSCGTPAYVCPEIIRGERYDGRGADVWSLGVILFAMSSGNLPFIHENIKQLLQNILDSEYRIPRFVDDDIADLIEMMLHPDPAERIKLSAIKTHRVFEGTNLFTPVSPKPMKYRQASAAVFREDKSPSAHAKTTGDVALAKKRVQQAQDDAGLSDKASMDGFASDLTPRSKQHQWPMSSRMRRGVARIEGSPHEGMGVEVWPVQEKTSWEAQFDEFSNPS